MGYDTLEYMSAALLDMEWHSISAEQAPEDVQAFEAQALDKRCLMYHLVISQHSLLAAIPLATMPICG